MNERPVVLSAARKRRSFKVLIAAVYAVVGLAAGFSQAYAAATVPCDPQFMDAIEARGYIEAQRQIEQNNNYIFQQDSVLEYTCFDKLEANLSDDGIWRLNAPFTDQNSQTPFVNPNGGGEYKQTNNTLWGSLSAVVWSALNTYIINNYGNKTKPWNYLAGRDGTPSWAYTAMPGQAAYNCADMENVWRAAHCMDFSDQPPHDDFYDFYWYVDPTDARTFDYSKPWSAANSCSALPPARKPIDDTHDIEVAFNNNGKNFSLKPENPWSTSNLTDTATYVADPVVTHLNLILPVGGGAPAPGACNTVQPEPTGICMVREGYTAVYQDAVCPNPGCFYKLPAAVTPGNGADVTTCPGALGTCGP